MANPIPKSAQRGVSKTAVLAAAIRANHWYRNATPIFTDDYALRMLPQFWKFAVTNRLLNWVVVDVVLRAFKPIHTENILRVRYAEDRLLEAVSAGVSQYVILGAGFDTFSLRHNAPADRLRVFELDHPATQTEKRKRLRAINGSLPVNLKLVAIDFETERLDKALLDAGFNPQSPAVFSWLGTTYYLSKQAIRDTLGQITKVAAPGSRIVLDYKMPRHFISKSDQALVDKLDRFVARLGEPMVSEFTPKELNDELLLVEFSEIDTVAPPEQASRYLKDRSDIADPAPNFCFACFGSRDNVKSRSSPPPSQSDPTGKNYSDV